jgi:hypothetical protein
MYFKFILLFIATTTLGYTQDSTSKLFSERYPIRLSLQGEFEKVRQANLGGNWGNEDRSDPKYWSDAILVDRNDPSHMFSAKIRARGKSSAFETEGDFPKLLVEIKKAELRDGTLFEGARKFRLNTHVSTFPNSERTPLGRLNSEKSPYREALAYEIAEAFGLDTPLTRRAEIDYIEVETDQRFIRKALAIETDKNIEERFDQKIISAEDYSAQQKTFVRLEDSALIHLFQSFIGNDDFILRVDQEPRITKNPISACNNVILLARDDGSRNPLPYDFDLSSIVSGEGMHDGENYLQPEFGLNDNASGYLAMMIASLRSRLPEKVVKTTFKKIKNRKSKILKTIQAAIVDEEGKKIALRHYERFFQLADILLKMPVVAEPGIHFFTSSDGMVSKLEEKPNGKAGTLRPGTPIKVLGKKDDFLEVQIIDFRLNLKEGESSRGFVPKNTKVAAWVPAEFLGYTDEQDDQ